MLPCSMISQAYILESFSFVFRPGKKKEGRELCSEKNPWPFLIHGRDEQVPSMLGRFLSGSVQPALLG